MKRFALAVVVMVGLFISQSSWAHQIYIKQNPTNQNGIEFGVNNASGFVRWRAYVKGLSNNSRGQNSGWTDSGNGWWYYDLNSISQRVMWRLDGIANQQFTVTYWVFRSDGSWDYGPQVNVLSDQVLPDAWFGNLSDGQIINQADYDIHVDSFDSLSGVAAIRIYVVIPAGLSLPNYWLPSGIANQYYLEFDFTSFVHEFVFPGSGNYRFTLWVKDKAGNIAYEPDGQFNVSVNLNTNPPPPPPPDPEPQPPAAPSNLSLLDQGNDVVISWQDNSTDETGFIIYRDWQYLATLPANTESYTDNDLVLGNNYCYRVVASKSNLNSQAIEACIYLEEPVNHYQYANGFIYPMACDYIYRIEPDNQIPDGACYDYQPFSSLFATLEKIHLGADLNLRGVNDLGEPVYAISNALIWDIGWTSGWGNYLILQINAAPGDYFWLSDGQTVNQVYTLYAHLDQIFVIDDQGQRINKDQLIEQQTYVGQGWQVGTVGDGNGHYSPHLHFEIRFNGYDQLGPGYWPKNDYSYLNNFTDPIEFIDNNWVDSNKKDLTIYVHSYDRLSDRNVYAYVNESWYRFGRESDGLPLSPVGWSNYFWLTNSSLENEAYWQFRLPLSGSWSVYTVIPRYYTLRSNQVHYFVNHAGQSEVSPTELIVDQTAYRNENAVVYLGTYYLPQNYYYEVSLISQPASYTVFDTLMLVFEGDFGSGGGDPPDDQIKTITTEQDLHFAYVGNYNLPELHCSGGGFDWSDLILQNGEIEISVAAGFSDQVICNVEFENNQWLANDQGILSGHHLYVNNQEIRSLLPNGLGGNNLVFNLVVNELVNPPPEPDDLPAGNNDSGNKKSNSGSLGCHINQSINAGTAIINFVIILLPAIIVFLWRKFS